MNPLFKRATGMLQGRSGGASKMMGAGPMAQPKAPSGGGDLVSRLRGRIRGPKMAGGPTAMKQPPMEPDGDERM